ncbi:hypothetical protein AsGV027 [Agrotis segetum granulovirus]|uniref:Uncharacterized protein n=1 Tax=Agrotis segetum granulosis virus TaxID=10464 RepID=A0A023MHE1_GVAS|nr:hypothetical protein AsGV027 [Agrotis segetum granulovirus]AHN92066.1 hypothetical protein AsGV027 [Agrotis segetum granulovirus]AKN63301.1 hypothetical protein AsGV027 [Agrotis segetum granulovirus]
MDVAEHDLHFSDEENEEVNKIFNSKTTKRVTFKNDVDECHKAVISIQEVPHKIKKRPKPFVSSEEKAAKRRRDSQYIAEQEFVAEEEQFVMPNVNVPHSEEMRPNYNMLDPEMFEAEVKRENRVESDDDEKLREKTNGNNDDNSSSSSDEESEEDVEVKKEEVTPPPKSKKPNKAPVRFYIEDLINRLDEIIAEPAMLTENIRLIKEKVEQMTTIRRIQNIAPKKELKSYVHIYVGREVIGFFNNSYKQPKGVKANIHNETLKLEPAFSICVGYKSQKRANPLIKKLKVMGNQDLFRFSETPKKYRHCKLNKMWEYIETIHKFCTAQDLSPSTDNLHSCHKFIRYLIQNQNEENCTLTVENAL